MPRCDIRNQLVEVGFDDARQAEVVGGLSGGWKMKLELARAMLYNADLLLLDEVSIFGDLNDSIYPSCCFPCKPTNHVSANCSASCLSAHFLSSWIVLLLNGSSNI